MDPEFVAILQKLVAEQGKETLNTAKCKAFLSDYTRGEYKKESRLLSYEDEYTPTTKFLIT